MPAQTPISRSKTAAMARVVDCVPRGYMRHTSGVVSADKAVKLATKFHLLYGIGCTPAQRIVRKRKDVANAVLVLHWPENASQVQWLLLATVGAGLESESMQLVTDKPRLHWLGYELVRHSTRGRAAWTWRRPSEEMAELHALLAEQLNSRHHGAVRDTLERIARQPGFHGVRSQSWLLCKEARRRGYAGPLPFLYHVQKVSHGDPLLLSG